jgi:16S rRNA (guanine527-N7)-methyltransferase
MALRAPDRQFFLVESDSRKCEFVKHMIHVLKLQNVTVMNMRLESLKAEEIKNGISRGFASISKTLLLLNRSFPKGGKFFHLKGANWSSEIAEIPSQLISVWSPELVGEYSLPATQARRAVVCTTKSS